MSDRWTWVPHLWGLLTPVITAGCLVAGGPYMALPLVLFLGVYPFIELMLGQSSDTEPLQEEGLTTSSFTCTPCSSRSWWPSCCGAPASTA